MTLVSTANSPSSPNKVRKGRRLEEMAADFLQRNGCTLLDSNYQWRGGEVDLIMLAPGGELLFVEVRSRSSGGYGPAGETVDGHKWGQVRQAATHYLHCNPQLATRPCRFDVVAFDQHEDKGSQLSWLRGAFD